MQKQVQVIVSAVDKASDGLKSIASNFSEFGKKHKKTFEDMRNYGAAAFAGIAYGAKEMVDAFADSEAQMVKVDGILKTLSSDTIKKAGGSLDSLKEKINGVSEANIKLGFDDEDTATSMARLTAATGDYEKALSLNNLAMDLARYKGIGLAEASDTLIKVQAGQTRVLKELGIEVKEGTTAQEAFAIVMQKTAGQADGYSKTVAGGNEVMAVSMGNLKETIGGALAPAFSKLVTTLQPLIQQFTTWATNNSDLMAKIILVAGAVAGLMVVLGTLGTIIPLISVAITGLTTVVSALGTVIGLLNAPILLIIAAIGIWIYVIKELYQNWDDVVGGIKILAEGLVTYIVELFEGFRSWAVELWNNIRDIFVDAWESIKTVVFGVIDSFSAGVKSRLQGILDFVKSVTNAIVSGVRAAQELASNIGDSVKGAATNVYNTVTGKRALGGTVMGGRSYLVGENGPEIITPLTTSNVSQPQTNGGLSVSINLGNVNINNSQDENRLVQMIKNALIDEAKNFSLGITS